MPRPRLALQPSAVRVRLIQRGTGPGAVVVAGRSYVPVAEWTGAKLVPSGTYERRASEEAPFTIVFPNGPGPDGKLNRERFLLVKNRDDYRPGDEWFEIYKTSRRSAGGDLMYVGTPTKANETNDVITLSGWDGYWLTKKTRGTTTDIWNHAPRDVFEHYTQFWQAWRGDNFTTRPRLSGPSGTWQTTSDGLWIYSNAIDDPSGQGALLVPSGADGTATVAFIKTQDAGFGYGTTSDERYTAWRLEAELTVSALPTTGASIVLALGSGAGAVVLTMLGDGTVEATDDLGTNDFQSKVQAPNGKHSFAIEGRGRWLYFYIDGKLMGDARPLPQGDYTGGASLTVAANPPSAACRCSVTQLLMRRTRPFLLAGPVKGDYRLPGRPSPGGLAGSYYSDADIVADPGLQLAPTRSKSLARIDQALNFSEAAPTWAGGLKSNFSARWVGSIYLDLDNHDYRLQVNVDNGARVWVGRTRFGEQIIDDWPGVGNMHYTASSWLKGGASSAGAGAGSTGPLARQKSGWYPIVVEYRQLANGAGCILEYQRDDQPNLWVIAGSSSYPHLIRGASGLVAYWRMGEGHRTNGGVLRDHGPTGYPGTWEASAFAGVGTNAEHSFLRNALAQRFNPVVPAGGNVPHNSALAPAQWTVELWASPQTTDGTGAVATKKGQWAINRSASTWQATVTVGGVDKSVSGATAVGRYDHVVATYDGATLRLYVNGAFVGSTNAGGPMDGGTHTVGIGKLDDPLAYDYDGSAAEIALYSRVLTAQEATDHYNAGYLDYGADPGVQLSPLGTHQNLQAPRFDAHYDQLVTLRDTFGFQFTCEPMSLESGEFPGRLVPMTKIGRDTDYVLDQLNGGQPVTDIDAEPVADSLLADAQGIADPGGGAQLTAEAFNWGTLGQHLFESQEFESLSDITVMEMLRQRLLTMLGLRASPWEQVQVQPDGIEELRDSFPLTGALAKFSWLPGDGLKLRFPKIGVEDDSPRQIASVQQAFGPAGFQKPVVGFRQRPRGLKASLVRLWRSVVAQNRNYQRTIITVPSTAGSNNAAWAPDGTARAGLPAGLQQVIKATAIVTHKTDNSGWRIRVNGSDVVLNVTKADRYDVTAALANYDAGGTTSSQMVTADMAGGTGQYMLTLELRVAI